LLVDPEQHTGLPVSPLLIVLVRLYIESISVARGNNNRRVIDSKIKAIMVVIRANLSKPLDIVVVRKIIQRKYQNRILPKRYSIGIPKIDEPN